MRVNKQCDSAVPLCDHGFTLIEILVALVILAIALLAGVKLIGQSASSEIMTQQHTQATWVAEQIASEAQLGVLDFSNQASQQGHEQMLGQHWPWSAKAEPVVPVGQHLQITVLNPQNQSSRVIVDTYLMPQVKQ